MMTPKWMLSELHSNNNLSAKKYDLNGDGKVDINDCPYPHGSPEAKLWWAKVIEPHDHYQGKPLVKGPGKGQGDFQKMVDKLQVTRGLSKESALKIAGATKARLYPRK